MSGRMNDMAAKENMSSSLNSRIKVRCSTGMPILCISLILYGKLFLIVKSLRFPLSISSLLEEELFSQSFNRS